MSEVDGWVLLVECHDVAELHALRATLEASGVPCRIQGENTHGIMGAFHGAMVSSRVLVPARALEVARSVVKDIVGPFDDAPEDEHTDADESPFRRPGESPPTREHDEPPPLRLKSYARLVLVGTLVIGPLLGLGHLYAGRNLQAGLLVLLTLFAGPAALGGAGWAQGVLVGVWLADIIGAAFGIAAHNRRVRAAAPAARAPASP